jgi:hypothetical protein
MRGSCNNMISGWISTTFAAASDDRTNSKIRLNYEINEVKDLNTQS